MCLSYGNIYVNAVKGDFIINEWDEDGYEKLEAKQKELESLGYVLKENKMDYLNQYFIYEKNNDKKIITFCRC
jgi:hypothetical protein